MACSKKYVIWECHWSQSIRSSTGTYKTSIKEKRMNANNKLIEIEDKKVTLSTLWVFVMFCIAYADIIGFIEPGTLENIINGNVGFELTPAMILIFSLFQAIPIAMILVS